MDHCRGRLAAHARSLHNPLLSDLYRIFDPWVRLPEGLGSLCRHRVFTPARTFWLFLSQVFSSDGSCREAVRKLQAWQAIQEQTTASPNTAGYCTARGRLSLDGLETVQQQVADKVQGAFPDHPEHRNASQRAAMSAGRGDAKAMASPRTGWVKRRRAA